MDKYVFDNCNGLWYELNGGQYYPCLTYLPKKKSLSRYGASGICGI